MNKQLEVQIKAKTEDFKQGVQEATKEVKTFAQRVKENSKKAEENIKAMGEKTKAAGKAIATGLAAATTAFIACGEATKEYRAKQGQLNSAFESAGSSAKQASKTYSELFRVLGDSDRATEAATHLSHITTNQKDLSQWTKICEGVWATYGESLPIEGLTEAANETAKTGAVTGVLADALNWAGVSEDKFNEKLEKCNNEAQREKLIRETLNGLYSDSADAYEKNNKSVLDANDAQNKLNETLAEVGTIAEPIMTTLKELAAEALEKIKPYLQDFSENYLPIIKDTLIEVAKKLGEVLGFLIQHPAILITIAAVIGTLVTIIGMYNAVAAIKAAMDAAQVTTLGALIAAQWASVAATVAALAPYLAIVAAIGLVVAAVVLCIKNWESMKEAFYLLGEEILFKLENIKTKFHEILDKIKNGIKEKLEAAKNFVKEKIDKIKSFFNFKWELPKLKLPHFSITGEFKISPPQVPKFNISWYAKGGVFEQPTLFNYGNGAIGGLGEAGAEAVVPLENNTKWLDKIAEKLAGKTSSTPIVLQVDGKTFAQTSISTINQLTRQTGALGLVLG